MTTLSKSTEHKRVFAALPAVLIQNPSKSCAYFLEASELARFQVNASDLVGMKPGTVTFSICGEELVDEVPPFNQDPGSTPDVLVRYLEDRTAYLIPASELAKFEIDQPEFSFGDHYVSFIMPSGMELVEEIPFLKRGMLQSNTG